MQVPDGRVREMLREFARFSLRDDSPTSRLTVQQVYDELMEVERRQRVHDGLDEDEPMPEADQQVDNADQLVYEGQATLEQSVNRDIESIRATRMRMVNELHERIAVAEAYSDQELIWQLEEQLDWWINASWLHRIFICSIEWRSLLVKWCSYLMVWYGQVLFIPTWRATHEPMRWRLNTGSYSLHICNGYCIGEMWAVVVSRNVHGMDRKDSLHGVSELCTWALEMQLVVAKGKARAQWLRR